MRFFVQRFTPYRFRHGKQARNRIVVPPMASQTADARGFATEATVAHYHRLARSGAGLVFVEYSFVHPSGKGEENQLGASEDAQIEGLARIAQAIHSQGALAALQIVHVGGKSQASLAGRELMSPSGVRVPVKGLESDASRAMNAEEIQAWKAWFLASARRAARAGFDFVELHAAHGYGLNQWLSPLTNQRSDGYGGGILGRSRLLLEIARSLRTELPELLLAVRLPAQDHFSGGLTPEEMGIVAQELEKIGVDLLDVSSGIGGWRRPEGRAGEGYLLPDATLLKGFTSLPVIGVGGIESGEFVDEAIQAGKVDFCAIGRAILKDPLAWRSTNLERELCPTSCSAL